MLDNLYKSIYALWIDYVNVDKMINKKGQKSEISAFYLEIGYIDMQSIRCIMVILYSPVTRQ